MPKLIIDPIKGPYVAEGAAGIDILAGTTITYIGLSTEVSSGTFTYASGALETFASGSILTLQSGSNSFFSGSVTFASGSQATLASGSLLLYSSGSNTRVSGAVSFGTGSLLQIASGSNVNFASGSNSQFFGLAQYQSGSEQDLQSGALIVAASGSNQRMSGTVSFASASLLQLVTGSVFIHDAPFEGSHLIRGVTSLQAAFKVSGTLQIDGSDTTAQTNSGSIMLVAANSPTLGGPCIGIGVRKENISGPTSWANTRLVLSGTDTPVSKRQIAITMHATGSSTGNGNGGIDGNPVLASIFVFTDGSDLFIKLSSGVVKKVTAV